MKCKKYFQEALKKFLELRNLIQYCYVSQVAEVYGIKIFRYAGSLNFVNSGQLGSELQEKVGVRPQQVLKWRAKLAKRGLYAEPAELESGFSLRCVVIDMSAVSRIDASGVRALRETVAEFGSIDVPVYLAACSGPVFDRIHKCELLEHGEFGFMVFATVHDAVFFAQRELLAKSA